MRDPSVRAQVITRRSYNRPLEDGRYETWSDTVGRAISHQAYLWGRATGGGAVLWDPELDELRQLVLDRKVLLAGRTLWLGGTELSRRREASQFNCSFTHVETIQDLVDVLWLLLQGCGVGFRPIVGQLTGYQQVVPELEIIRSKRRTKGGVEHNVETFDESTGVWTIKVGDSAEAWAKSLGKLVAHTYPARKLVLDFSELRPAGQVLKGYGWISSGDAAITKAFSAIHEILNRRAASLLTRIDLLDIVNWCGTILSSRRSAEIALFAYGEDEWQDFATAKRDSWVENPQREQSNNSLLFRAKPSRAELENIFALMAESGGSEPGFVNQAAATRRAPWFKGVNPCAEILLGNKSFCNLVEVDVARFKGDSAGLRRAVTLAARACYRQTCVDLNDGILQESWHRNNQFLRLCGVGLTGIARRPDLQPYDYAELQRVATAAAYGMADELGLPHPKNVTTVKPSGTLSKIMDTTEGMHKPLGRYIFNNVNFSIHDPLLPKLRAAGYKVTGHPIDPVSVLVTLTQAWEDVPFEMVNGTPVNLEPAVAQLERYAMLMRHWCHQNVSCTVSYSPDEVPAIIDWLLANWDNYVGVSFLYRADPTKTAADLGYAYLPQEVVTREAFAAYTSRLAPLVVDSTTVPVELEDDCAGGACPIR